ACAYLNEYCQRVDAQSIYAAQSLIAKLLINAYAITYMYLDIFSQKHIYSIILDFMYILNNNNMMDSTLNQIHKSIITNYEDISVLIPFATKLMTCLDTLYLSLVNREYLIYKLKVNAGTSILHQYHFFEGIWMGWIQNQNFEQQRLICMRNLNRFDIDSVEDLMNDPIQSRNAGWITGQLNFPNNEISFKDIDGFRINKVTGEVSFLFYGQGLFTMEDTMEILGNGITCAFYTLEPPDVKQRHNPYQKQIYGPNCISRTRYLATLLGADYLLKMFSTGTEVNADYPFEFRRFNHGIDYINPVKGMGGQVTRFWIEPKELEYTQSTD